jgi:hypothetical protein
MRCEILSDYESLCRTHTIEDVQTCEKLNTVKTEDAAREGIAELSAPFSAWEGGPSVRNMADWVRRPTHVREQEIEPHGYIPRPLNSFMLYRSAYLPRAEAWCNKNMPPNEQKKQTNLSSLIAQSWKMEDSDIRKSYQEHAVTESINHKNAHKSYKFAPRRTASKQTARRRTAPRIKRRKKEGSDSRGSRSQGYAGSISHDPLTASHAPEIPAVQPTQYCSQFLGPTSRPCCVLSYNTTYAPCICNMRSTSQHHHTNSEVVLNGGEWTYATPPGGSYGYSFPPYLVDYPGYFATTWSGDDFSSLRI